MKGDRVRIGPTGTFKEEKGAMVHVYEPQKDPNRAGYYLQAGDGTVIVESLGGVYAGTTGTIDGEPIRVHRAQLKTYEGVPGLGANDSVLLYPINLDLYQRVGWFSVDDIKIMAGGQA